MDRDAQIRQIPPPAHPVREVIFVFHLAERRLVPDFVSTHVASPFSALCFSRANQMWNVVARREPNHEYLAADRFSDADKALLAFGVLVVVDRHDQRVEKNSLGLFERDAVLLQVFFGLLRIPRWLHAP